MEEKLTLFSTVLSAVGDKASVIAGTGSNDTKASVELTCEAEILGVHGAMLVGPYYNKPPQEGLYQHFKAIAEKTSLPLVVYNVPGRTCSNILPATIARLAAIDNIVAVKEASGSIDQVAEIMRSTSKEFMVYSGDDSLTLPLMSLGCEGIISVAAHVVGKLMQEMLAAYLSGHNEQAAAIHLHLLPFFKVIFITTNPIPIKTCLSLQGHPVGPLRLPLIGPSPEEIDVIRKVMNQLALL
jgi:4-hydroxy-tetrahydrodipicolinate synthase